MSNAPNTIIAEIEIPIRGSDPDADAPVVKVEIDFSYSKGCPASWEDPGYGAEIEVTKASLSDGDGLTLTDDQVDALARAYLRSDDGYRHACKEAERCRFFH